MSLIQLVYFSQNAIPGGFSNLMSETRNILKKATANNSALDISGYLLFDKIWFLQVLEGPKPAVMLIYDKISADTRHKNIQLVGTKPIKTRTFGAWSMGAAARTTDKYSIFLRHGIGSTIDPHKLSVNTIISLAHDLARTSTKDEILD